MDYRLKLRTGVNKLNKYYIIVIALLIGIIGGMMQNNLVVPAFNTTGAYYHGVRGRNQVSIVFNVDWGEEYIPGILRILDKKGVNVTFFVTGNWANKFPDLIQGMVFYGNEIGNHGFSHKRPKTLSNSGLIDLIKRNEELIYELTGKKTKLFAPPYGEVDKRITSVAESIGYKTVMWSADTIDWQRPASEIIVQRAINKIEDGGIILMHPTEPSLKALPDILESLEQRGFELVTVSRLISN